MTNAHDISASNHVYNITVGYRLGHRGRLLQFLRLRHLGMQLRQLLNLHQIIHKVSTIIKTFSGLFLE